MRSQFVSRMQVLLFAVLVLSGFIALPAWTQTVFINEIHYDNTGTDAGEAIEIAGPAERRSLQWRQRTDVRHRCTYRYHFK